MKTYIQPTIKVRAVILNAAYTYTNSKGQSCATPQKKMMDMQVEKEMQKEEFGNLW